ncbi:MAG: sel1 repeat family protein [Alphaproteobacteria bacterium]|nr:sel1 repeat family protein [Alphaproteobacteria bacterium]
MSPSRKSPSALALGLCLALALALPAWAQGDEAERAFRRGEAYLKGAEVERDNRAAAEWFERAAAQDHPGALYQLGLMARRGQLGKPDVKRSVEYLKRAVQAGHGLAMARLGIDYLEGSGVEKDPILAYALLKMAAARGVQAAATQQKRVAADLTPAQLAEAERAIELIDKSAHACCKPK